MERALAGCSAGRVTLEELPPLPVGGRSAGSFVDQEREILRRAMERAGGNKTRAARALGLKRTTLIDKLRRLGLEAPGPATPNTDGTLSRSKLALGRATLEIAQEGVAAASTPIVEVGPCPGRNAVSSGKLRSCSRIERSKVAWSPRGRSVRPMEP